MKAMGKLFEDPRRRSHRGSDRGLQRAKTALDEAQQKALRARGW